MDGEIKTLNTEMKSISNNRFSSEINESLKEVCLDAASCLSIFKILVQNADHRIHILDLSRNVIQVIKTGTILEIEIIIDEFVKALIKSLVIKFEPIDTDLENWIQEIRLNFNTRLASKILGKVIVNILTKTSKIMEDFQTCWQSYFSLKFTEINLINHENTYLKAYLFSILCDNPYSGNFHSRINRSKLSAFESIFGDVKNFKFIQKACKISDLLAKIPNTPLVANPFSIICTVSKINSSISNQNLILKEGDRFVIGPTGLNGSLRPDNIVLVGNHSFCDIRLPEDKNLENLSFAMLCTPRQYYIIDCSKTNYLKVKLFGNAEYDFNQDSLIDIAQSALIHIIKLDCREDQEGHLNGTLHYEFLRGELANQYGDRNKTANPIDGIIVLGRGLFNHRTDIVISENGRVSGQHMEFRYSKNKWKIADLNSTNGTFLAYKTCNQYQNKNPSEVFCLFETKTVKIETVEKTEPVEQIVKPIRQNLCIATSGIGFYIESQIPAEEN